MAMVPRPAATLILLRPGKDGPEVLMIQRTQSAAFLGGAYVFPGGALDPQDSDERILKRTINLTAQQANARLGVPDNGLAYYVASVRECFEESGIALFSDKSGKIIPASRAEALMQHRTQPFVELIEAQDLFIPAGALAYYGHWIT